MIHEMAKWNVSIYRSLFCIISALFISGVPTYLVNSVMFSHNVVLCKFIIFLYDLRIWNFSLSYPDGSDVIFSNPNCVLHHFTIWMIAYTLIAICISLISNQCKNSVLFSCFLLRLVFAPRCTFWKVMSNVLQQKRFLGVAHTKSYNVENKKKGRW